jgi:hypothetical protein
MGLLPSWGEWRELPTFASLLASANLNRVVVSPITWRRKQIQFRNLEFSSYLEFRTMDNVQKLLRWL